MSFEVRGFARSPASPALPPGTARHDQYSYGANSDLESEVLGDLEVFLMHALGLSSLSEVGVCSPPTHTHGV